MQVFYFCSHWSPRPTFDTHHHWSSVTWHWDNQWPCVRYTGLHMSTLYLTVRGTITVTRQHSDSNLYRLTPFSTLSSSLTPSSSAFFLSNASLLLISFCRLTLAASIAAALSLRKPGIATNLESRTLWYLTVYLFTAPFDFVLKEETRLYIHFYYQFRDERQKGEYLPLKLGVSCSRLLMYVECWRPVPPPHQSCMQKVTGHPSYL